MGQSWVDEPDILTIDEPTFPPARVQVRELSRERVEGLRYVAWVAAPDGDKHVIGLELEHGRCRTLPTPKNGGEGWGDAGRGRRGDDEVSQGQGRAGRSQQKHAPGMWLLPAHGQEGEALDRDANGVQRVDERAGGVSRDAIRGQSDARRYCVACCIMTLHVCYVLQYLAA